MPCGLNCNRGRGKERVVDRQGRILGGRGGGENGQDWKKGRVEEQELLYALYFPRYCVLHDTV